MLATDLEVKQAVQCVYCGGSRHQPERCPRVEHIEYHPGGAIASVDLRPMPPNGRIEVGSLIVDLDRAETFWRGKRVDLSLGLMRVAHYLAGRSGAISDRFTIMDVAKPEYGGRKITTDRAVDTSIKRMRLEFRAVDPEFDALKTVYGGGYKWSE